MIQFPEFRLYMPDNLPAGRQIDRTYFFNIMMTLNSDYTISKTHTAQNAAGAAEETAGADVNAVNDRENSAESSGNRGGRGRAAGGRVMGVPIWNSKRIPNIRPPLINSVVTL